MISKQFVSQYIQKQATANYLVNKYPNRAIILFECKHEGKKQKHHPDYDKPYEVELLCCSCHGKRKRNMYVKYVKRIPKFKINIILKTMKNQDLTKSELAKRIDISRQRLHYYFTHPTLDSVWQIAYALKLDLWDLIK
jgi:DNA-binding NtrC family response regulator